MMQTEMSELTEFEESELRALVRRIARRSPVRRAAERLLNGEGLSEEEIAVLIEEVGRRSNARWRARIAAMWILREVPLASERREAVVRLLNLLVRGRLGVDPVGRVARWLLRSVEFSFTFCLTVLLLMCLSSIHGTGTIVSLTSDGVYGLCWTFIVSSLLFFVPILLASDVIEYDRLSQVQSAAATALGRIGDVESVGILARLAYKRGRGPGSAEERALRALLPLLTPAHYGRLDAETVPHLCDLLLTMIEGYMIVGGYRGRYPFAVSDEDLILSLLNALGKIGDGRAVGPVQTVAWRCGETPVGEAADRILPMLRERQQRERDASRLLRPADSPEEAADVLLRPAKDVGGADPEVLLRPSMGEEEG